MGALWPQPRATTTTRERELGLLAYAALAGLWIWTAVVTAASVNLLLSDLSSHDVAAFYRSAHAWMTTGDLYDLARDPGVNLNPPHLSVLLFVPLLLWSLPTAVIVWVTLQAAAGAVALWLIVEEVPLSATTRALVVPVVLASSAAQHQIREGQIGGVLLLLATLAWRSARHDQADVTLWTALGASVKPWMACWIPLLPRRRALAAIALGGAGLVLGVVLLGVDTWTDWSTTVASRPVHPNVINFSVLGAIARATRQTLTSSPGWPISAFWLAGCAVIGGLSLLAWRGGVDRAWLVFGLAGILVSPFGWAYYVLVITGPLVAWGEQHRWPWPACMAIGSLLLTREFLERLSAIGWVAGSLGFVGVLLLWGTALGWTAAMESYHDRVTRHATRPIKHGIDREF